MKYIKLLGAGVFLAMSGLGLAKQDKPNVILILIDDLGWADIGCYGSKFYETPHIDSLARRGMKFTNAYAGSAICSPTRASIMTGKYPARVGITRASPQKNLPFEEVTIAEALKEEGGYKTCHVGKWHLQGHGEKKVVSYPEHHGFDVNIAGHSAGQPATFFYPYKSKGEKYSKNNVPGLDGGKEGEYLTDRLTDEAIKFMKASKAEGKPFYLNMWYYTVHTPVMGKIDKVEKYKKKLEGLDSNAYSVVHRQKEELGGGSHMAVQCNPEYAAMVESMDENVGRLLGSLKEMGLEDDTIVIFTSDNGGLSNGKVTSNTPLRAGKAWIYEGGIREPLIVYWPGKTKAGAVAKVPVISMDFYPTILEMVGLPEKPEQHMDGVSIAGVLEGKEEVLKREDLFFHLPVYHHVNTMGPVAAVRSGDWKLVRRYEEPEAVELYDLGKDLSESKNVAKEHPQVVARLVKKLDAWHVETGAEAPTPEQVQATLAKVKEAKANREKAKKGRKK